MKRLKSEERKEQIIKEAKKIIHKYGFEYLTTKRLAARVKVSEAALYRHFKNKEDIILGILSSIKEFNDYLTRHIEEYKDKKEKIYELICSHFKYFQENPEMTSIVFSEDIFRNGKFLRNKLLEIISERRKIICGALEDVKDSRKLKNIETCQLADIILGFIRFVVLQWRLSGYKYSILEKGQIEAKTLLKLIYNN